MDLRIDLNDLGWIVVMVGDEWFSAQALQKCFEGISYDVWEAAARQLRQRYPAKAAIHEETVARALDKIGEANSAEQSRFGAVLQAVTPAGLQRGEEDLYLGLSILPDDPEGFDLPPEEDLFGHQVPQPKADGGSEFTAPETGGGARAANDGAPAQETAWAVRVSSRSQRDMPLETPRGISWLYEPRGLEARLRKIGISCASWSPSENASQAQPANPSY
ncbi:hypothetical protein MACH17_03900 [Phaeobacter inhibens]|nr:hypothetical protein MACH17_03900 [Phaeobacter inhibens]